ncbi:MAG: hypothetical protein KBT20_06100 [Bacteroidales bacterium]|nr:hypothetical protein [Candidatus Liminaster caballi]
MDAIRNLHNEAMDIAQMAQIKLQKGEHEEAKEMFLTAFDKERSAAMLAVEQQLSQPGLSILLQSAAHLAVTCGKEREAEKLAGLALAGEIPEEIASDLRLLVSNLYTKGEGDYETYQVQIPSNDNSVVSALNIMLERMGCTFRKVHNSARKIAVL